MTMQDRAPAVFDRSVALAGEAREIGRTLFRRSAAVTALVVGPSDLSVDDTLDIPAGALVHSAVMTVQAAPGGPAKVSAVAVVRPGTPSAAMAVPSTALAFVVDFQRLRTVSELHTTDVPVLAVYAWGGAGFLTQPPLFRADGDADATSNVLFAETQTERLLVITGSFTPEAPYATAAEELTAKTTAVLPSPPADLELLVNSKRVWSRPGPVRPGPHASAGGASSPAIFFSQDVDITDAVQAAVSSGPVPVVVSLTSSVPGRLGLAHDVAAFPVHAVAFPEGDARAVTFAAEGMGALALPVPPEAAGWLVHEVRTIVAADLPTTRVEPPVGPPASPDAQLVVDLDRPLHVQLPAAALDAFDALVGVRLAVRAGPSGADMVGVLLSDAGGAPGAPLPGAPFGPLSLDPALADSAPRWVSLLVPRPRKLARAKPIWLALTVARGELVLPVTVPPAGAVPANALYRGPIGGPYHPVRTLAGVAPGGFGAMIRLIGDAATVRVPALDLWFAGSDVGVSAIPTAAGVALNVVPYARAADGRLVAAAAPGSDPAVVSGGALQLVLRAHVAGTFKFRDTRIIYSARP